MRLITPYAPPTFLKPVIIIDTVFIEGGEAETAVLFNKALNANHALGFATDEIRKIEEITGEKKVSAFIPIKQHKSRAEATQFHLELTEDLHNGGSDEQWELGFPTYLKLYDKYCPDELKDWMDVNSDKQVRENI